MTTGSAREKIFSPFTCNWKCLSKIMFKQDVTLFGKQSELSKVFVFCKVIGKDCWAIASIAMFQVTCYLSNNVQVKET